MNIREKLPVRRLNPSKNPSKNWSKHKPDLRQDFNNHCAYCGTFDGFKHTYFEVDHFIPKDLFLKNGKITLTQYSNLVYSCKFCNNNKLAKWPSKREDLCNLNDEGFIDPCDAEFEKHLYRTEDGGIMWNTKLGEWMTKIAFKFDERNYSIRLLWELNERRKLIDAFVVELGKIDKGSEDYEAIKGEAEKICFEYYSYHKELMEYYNSI